MLKGAFFNPNVTTKSDRFCESQESWTHRFKAFLAEIEDCNRTKESIQDSMIVYADNNRLSRDLMKRLIGGLGLDHRLKMFQNGK